MTSSSFRERLVPALPRRPEVGAAALAWAGCAAGLVQGSHRGPLVGAVLAVAVAAGLAIGRRGRPARGAMLVCVVAAGLLSGTLAAGRATTAAAVPITPGAVHVLARAVSDPAPGRFGPVLPVRAAAPGHGGEIVLLVSYDGLLDPGQAEPVAAGDLLAVDGVVADRPGRFRGVDYRATLDADAVEVVATAGGPLFGPGNLLRRIVLDRLRAEGSEASALVAGFLVGDSNGLPEDRLEQLRAAGLTHFVAVSGSNVALFLAAWWLVVGPLGLDPRVRALGGLVALAVFVVATRWEPSVVRAATMAGVVLGGRIAGLPVDPWRALGVAVTGLLLFAADLAGDVGFQLSVAATAGVLVAVRLAPRRRPRWVWTVLSVTVGAQLAVLPIVLATFGSVPLLSPVANVLALPLVTTATVLGGIGAVTGLGPVLDLGLLAGRGVLAVASIASGWPQVGLGGVTVAAVVAFGVWIAGRARTLLIVVVAAGIAAWVIPVPAPSEPAVVFLDVGQGDAILVRLPPATVILFDGGGDPAVLEAALRRHGVGAIDVVAVTHGDADHAGGLQGLFDRHEVGQLWYPEDQHTGDLVDALLGAAAELRIPAAAVGAGDEADFGPLHLELLGPRRRYAADNDGSIVTAVTAGGIEVLLTGDIEAVGQADLPAIRPDVLQVPHHGSATTDLAWLAASLGPVAVVSVGENPYGHPRPEVVEVLDRAGAVVWSTMEHGDVVVPLCPCPPAP